MKLLFCGVVMSLGWGLRGFIGGGPLGAMIPGAMVTLAMMRVYGWRLDPVLLAFGAVGIGFGGEETYGQTVQFARSVETYWRGAMGLGLKGAVWGLLGGAVLGWGLRVERTQVWQGVALMIAAAWAGWRWINHPKLLYFSNRLDRPREEVWAGLLLAALVLLVWLRSRDAWRLALAGFVGGGIGFGGGGAWMLLARANPRGDWWKGMEWTFGLCLGVALAWAAARVEGPGERRAEKRIPEWLEFTLCFAMTALAVLGEGRIPARFSFVVTGGGLLLLSWYVRGWMAWPVGMGIAYLASAMDLVKHRAWAQWWAVAMSVGYVAAVVRWREQAFWLLTFGCLVVSQFKAGAMTQVQIVFWVQAALIVVLAQGSAMKPWRIFQR